MGLDSRCFRGYNGFRENYSTKISNAHERAPILSGRANGTTKFIQRKLCRQLSTKFKAYTVVTLFSTLAHAQANFTSVLIGFNPVHLARSAPIEKWHKNCKDVSSTLDTTSFLLL